MKPPSQERVMNPDAKNAREIFLAAVKLSPDQWDAYLSEACSGDAELCRRVKQLLQAHAEVDSFLDASASGLGVTADQRLAEGPGTVIGHYKLLQQLGEGGMGIVYMAEQQEPVRRKVVLKIIKPGMDSHEVIARFEAERQALAMMEHINIARVLDAGTTDTSRPFFVMELVHGIPITKYCDDNKLTPRQRLELFIPVCQAVQHAHHKGIIHRDIKPSNVMVTMYDDKPVPKIIDFGVAKAVEQRLTEKSLFTHYGALLGTFEYMSPEQAELNAFGVDTRSDIYSLGVLLYELLTGTTPLERQRLREAAFGEIVRRIKEEEPVRPSLRLSSSGAALAGLSRERGTEPAKLTRLVRGELDWIVMRCLEKDRARRYDTATGLAQDIQHYLAEEPVLACPPSTWYRFRKMARRNKTAMTTTGLVAATLLLGVVVSVWQAVRATDAEQSATLERDRAVLAKAQTNKARQAEQQRAEELSNTLGKVEAAEQKEKMRAAELAVALKDLEAVNRLEKMALYAANVASAHRELDAGNLLDFYKYLEKGHPDFRGWEHDFLYTAPNQHLQLILRGHGSAVSDVAFSPDGKILATASVDNPVKLWNAVNGKEIMTLMKPEDKGRLVFYQKAAFSPDGKLLAIAANRSPVNQSAVEVWDIVSGKEVFNLTDLPGSVQCVAFSPDGKRIAAACGRAPGGGASLPYPGYVRLWDATSGRKVLDLSGWDRYVRGVAFSPDGRRLATASDEKTVKLWELASARIYLTLEGHTGIVGHVAFSPDGKSVASTSADNTVKLWDAASGQEIFSLGNIAGRGQKVLAWRLAPMASIWPVVVMRRSYGTWPAAEKLPASGDTPLMLVQLPSVPTANVLQPPPPATRAALPAT
jgi:eukaryotic-like serine/threonine-protein kinase